MNSYARISFWIIVLLLSLEFALAILHISIMTVFSGQEILEDLFDVGYESNVPTWFSSVQFLLLGLVCGSIYVFQRELHPEKKFSILWIACALGCFFLSLDEVAMIHETAGSLFERYLEGNETPTIDSALSDFNSYYWVLVYVPLALPIAIWLVWFFSRELGRYRIFPIVGMILFLLGAVGVDYHEGTCSDVDEDQITGIARWIVVEMDSYLIEEMLGVTLALMGCLFLSAELFPKYLGKIGAKNGDTSKLED